MILGLHPHDPCPHGQHNSCSTCKNTTGRHPQAHRRYQCQECQGKGTYENGRKCADCKGDGRDPRYGCFTCFRIWRLFRPAVALVGRQTGGDTDRPATWIGVCKEHYGQWFVEDPMDEDYIPPAQRLQVFLFDS